MSAEETHALRRAVLRADMPEASVEFPEDNGPAAIHLALFDEGQMVGVATFFPSPYEGRPAWQLRGMAVAVGVQGTGLGAALLAEGVARVRATGAKLLWANGRDSALGFYERQGWKVVGDRFDYGPMRLPHHVVVLDLGSADRLSDRLVRVSLHPTSGLSAYHSIDYERVWRTLRDDVPEMDRAVRHWIEQEAASEPEE